MFDVLKDVRVLDFGKFVAAPSATWLLSNMGAEVIKVEPVGGSPDREPFRLSDTVDGAGFVQLHSNKKSLCLDTESPEGREALGKLVASADVVVLGAPESTLQRQRLDYESLKQFNPRLVYLNVSAFTSVGPRADEVGFDGVGQAMSGAAYMSGFGDTPTRSFCSWVDVSTGAYSAFGIVCGLMERNRTGQGVKLETSLMTSAYAAMSWLLVEQAVTGRNRTRTGNRAQSSGPSDVFRTRDGWVVVQVLGNSMFRRVAKAVDHPEWCNDPRFVSDNARAEHGEYLSEAVGEWCGKRTTAEALETLRAARCTSVPICSLADALADPQVEALQLMQSIDHPGLDKPLPLMKAPLLVDGQLPPLRSRPPLAGEHTDALLREMGYSQAQIDTMRQARVV